jgi:hypothetical protein
LIAAIAIIARHAMSSNQRWRGNLSFMGSAYQKPGGSRHVLEALSRGAGDRVTVEIRKDALHWSLMTWSKRRKWLVLILAVLVLPALAAMQLRPVSPLRNAYNQIRRGMNAGQVAEVLERCGWNKYRPPWQLSGDWKPVGYVYFSLFGLSGVEFNTRGARVDMLTYQAADGETLTIRWEVPADWEDAQLVIPEGHVVGKEYQSGFEKKLRALWDRLRGMLHW